MGSGAEAVGVSHPGGQPLHAVGYRAIARADGPADWTGKRHREARRVGRRHCRVWNPRREAAAVSRARAVERLLRAGAPRRDVDVPGEVTLETLETMTDAMFSQLVMLGSSGMLLTGLIVLWRKHVPAYISAYRWQVWLLAGVTATVGYFTSDWRLFAVAFVLVVLKAIAIPALLRTMLRRFGAQPEVR